MIRITSVEILNDYKLLLDWTNGERRIFDMSSELTGLFEELRDRTVFEKVQIEHGVLTWFRVNEMELDICPDYTYSKSICYSEFSD